MFWLAAQLAAWLLAEGVPPMIGSACEPEEATHLESPTADLSHAAMLECLQCTESSPVSIEEEDE